MEFVHRNNLKFCEVLKNEILLGFIRKNNLQFLILRAISHPLVRKKSFLLLFVSNKTKIFGCKTLIISQGVHGYDFTHADDAQNR